MTQPHYPPITEATLTPFRAVEIQLRENPGLLDDAACPYDPLVKAMLRRLSGDVTVSTGSVELMTDPAAGELDSEIADLYRTVKRDMQTYTGSDMKDKMAFLKTAQDLLTKLVDLQTRRINIRNMAQAMRAVIEVMEEFLTPAQRTEFIEKLGEMAEAKANHA